MRDAPAEGNRIWQKTRLRHGGWVTAGVGSCHEWVKWECPALLSRAGQCFRAEDKEPASPAGLLLLGSAVLLMLPESIVTPYLSRLGRIVVAATDRQCHTDAWFAVRLALLSGVSGMPQIVSCPFCQQQFVIAKDQFRRLCEQPGHL